MQKDQWLVLILSLPTENATLRMRAWRTLKALGAAVIRDGVYVLPNLPQCNTDCERIAEEVNTGGGYALFTQLLEPDSGGFIDLFDRTNDYSALAQDINLLYQNLQAGAPAQQVRALRKLRKQHVQIAAIDYFPGIGQSQSALALAELEQAASRLSSPDEPAFAEGQVARCALTDYQNKTWATRRRPWVDRLASAWLISRFIDPKAKFMWLASPADCPADVIGFDFDGASFTHLDARVTFEVLIASFGLADAGLERMAALIHYLDVGGIQPPDAPGVENILAGLRDSVNDDDQLLALSNSIFDGLLTQYKKANNHA